MITIYNKKKDNQDKFGNLNVGNTFLYDKQLYIKCGTRAALNLDCGGEFDEILNVDLLVTPVDIDITIRYN